MSRTERCSHFRNSSIVDTLETWRSVSYREVFSFQEQFYCGHLGDLVKCLVQRGVLISGTVLLWTPWRPGEVSRTERCSHFRNSSIVDTLETW